MSKFLKKRSHKIGLPPGSLVHIGEVMTSPVRLSVIDYDETELIEHPDATIEQCLSCLSTPSTTWITIEGLHDLKTIEQIGSHFHVHPLVMEDIVNTGQRAKMDDYEEQIFIVMRLLKFDTEKQEIVDEQISIVLSKDMVLMFIEKEESIFKSVRERIKKENSRIRQMGADFLCYSLIDCIVDQYFIILEKVDDKLEKLEEDLLSQHNHNTAQKIEKIKREIILLRRWVWPLRELISQLIRLEGPLFKDATKIFLRDVYDHTIQLIDTIESFRDISSGMLDLYLSNLTQRTNDIMKVLTIVSTIFVPLTFIASLYGMNFDNIPELHSKYGYPFVLSVMFVMGVSMLLFFRKKNWI